MRNIIMGIIEPSLSLMMSYVCNCRSFACQYPEREREREGDEISVSYCRTKYQERSETK